MCIRNKRILGILGLLMGVLLVVLGCGKNSTSGKAAYLSQMSEEMNVVQQSMDDLKNSFGSFDGESLSDKKWASDMNKSLDRIVKTCDGLIAKDGVPEDYTDLHNKAKDVATALKASAEAYKNGIETKDYKVLERANNQLAVAAAAMDPYIQALGQLNTTQ